mmetsp:Transcript_33800/g.80521  ORF Transcript_33800/g.80521 Transcript_33800/m.80521 type:complete len:212 (+) Transcript_33800:77-712(+)
MCVEAGEEGHCQEVESGPPPRSPPALPSSPACCAGPRGLGRGGGRRQQGGATVAAPAPAGLLPVSGTHPQSTRMHTRARARTHTASVTATGSIRWQWQWHSPGLRAASPSSESDGAVRGLGWDGMGWEGRGWTGAAEALGEGVAGARPEENDAISPVLISHTHTQTPLTSESEGPQPSHLKAHTSDFSALSPQPSYPPDLRPQTPQASPLP